MSGNWFRTDSQSAKEQVAPSALFLVHWQSPQPLKMLFTNLSVRGFFTASSLCSVPVSGGRIK